MSSWPSSIPILPTRLPSPPGWSGCVPSSAPYGSPKCAASALPRPGRCPDGHHQGRVSAIEHAKPGTTELRTLALAAHVEALGGRLEIIADFGDQRLAFTEPGTEAA